MGNGSNSPGAPASGISGWYEANPSPPTRYGSASRSRRYAPRLLSLGSMPSRLRRRRRALDRFRVVRTRSTESHSSPAQSRTRWNASLPGTSLSPGLSQPVVQLTQCSNLAGDPAIGRTGLASRVIPASVNAVMNRPLDVRGPAVTDHQHLVFGRMSYPREGIVEELLGRLRRPNLLGNR